MGFSPVFILFFLCISFHPVYGNSDLIQKTCKNTKYYDLCISSLKSDSTSSKSDTKGLAVIMVKVGISNATATNSYLSTQLSTSTNDTLMKKVMKECAQKYAFASDSLRNSVQDLGAELYDYAYMHVMAAADYPNACKNAFKRYSGLVYPPEIAVREEGLKHICDVVMSIIENLLAMN
ncbi:cell wall / vacuolar inhibitor of fructosidase 2-like [Olea europaea var. sylvestris]|uniref:cell wall / vacuolar inhibitor of fructosidase 2-like n=1 Tax=Olea europaea var. sylvestris TaxID=158386 RepID=UPI000C1CE1AD|nr:cell wall / vacuolar inhibitor of fructosidase 2-like [Olea europaea var. sylvestris]